MLDEQGILKDYLPFHVIHVGDVCDDHPEYGESTGYLSEYDFTWQLQTESRDTPQMYLGDKPLVFKSEGADNKNDEFLPALQSKIGNNPLRIPRISSCWGMDQSMMFATELADQLSFSPILGITRTEATLIDSAGHEHTGFTALTFHKALRADRIELRLKDLPVSERPILPVALKDRNVLLIHKDVLAEWKQQGIDDVEYEPDEEYQRLASLEKMTMYYQSGGNRDFSTLQDYQDNKNGRTYKM